MHSTMLKPLVIMTPNVVIMRAPRPARKSTIYEGRGWELMLAVETQWAAICHGAISVQFAVCISAREPHAASKTTVLDATRLQCLQLMIVSMSKSNAICTR